VFSAYILHLKIVYCCRLQATPNFSQFHKRFFAGHGPYSHMFDNKFLPRMGKGIKVNFLEAAFGIYATAVLVKQYGKQMKQG